MALVIEGEVQLQELENNAELSIIPHLQETASLLSEIYLRSGYFQEAIWTLKRGELSQDAALLETQIENYLLNAKLPAFEKDRVQNSYFKTVKLLNNGIKVFLKSSDRGWTLGVANEILVYKLDELLGIHRVPLVVKKQIYQTDFSMHLWLKDAKTSYINFNKDWNSASADEVFVLDYLTQQRDRNDENSIITTGGRLAIICNTRILYESPRDSQELNPGNSPLKINERLVTRLHQINESELFEALKDWGETHDINSIWKRLEQIKAKYPNPHFVRVESKHSQFYKKARASNYVTQPLSKLTVLQKCIRILPSLGSAR